MATTEDLLDRIIQLEARVSWLEYIMRGVDLDLGYSMGVVKRHENKETVLRNLQQIRERVRNGLDPRQS